MKLFNSAVLAVVAVFVAAVFVLPAAPAEAVSSASLSIVPKKNYTIKAGKSVKDTLIVRNLDAEKTLDLTLRVVDFTYTNDGGTPKLMLAEDAPQTTWSLKPFMTVPKTVKIAPKASKTLDMSVAIPAGHGAGSYYSAIVYSSGAPEGGNVGLSASGVTLVFTQIPGKVNEALTLEKLGAYHAATSGSEGDYAFISTKEPQMIAYTLKNGGNVTESPVGTITVKNMFGKERVITDINPNSSLALIDQTRTFTSCIQLKAEQVDFRGTKTNTKACVSPGLWPGRYTATLDAYYGQNGNRTQQINSTVSFWYMPYWAIVILIILLLLIAYGIWKIVQVVKGGKRRTNSRKRTRRRR